MKNQTRGLFVAAVLLVAAYVIAEALGLRLDTSTISGTISTGDWTSSVFLCIIYIGLYFGAVLAAPILALAAVISAVFGALTRRLDTRL